MNLPAAATAAAVCFAAGAYAGVEWQQGRDAVALLAAQAANQRVERLAGTITEAYVENISTLSRQLGDARVQLRGLTSGRDCLPAAAVSVLNSTGNLPSSPVGAAPTPAAAATDRDVGDALAICRGEYSKLAEQLNRILDIEDMRH